MAAMMGKTDQVISESIHVYVRIRPDIQVAPNPAFDDSFDDDEEKKHTEDDNEEEQREKSANNDPKQGDNGVIDFDIDGKCVYGSIGQQKQQQHQQGRQRGQLTEFSFDSCLGGTSSQEEVYNACARPIVESALRGYSGTILAYGPTGSGKTFTMRGGADDETSGIIPRCMSQILRSTHGTTGIWVSYLQIYCESLGDLLNPQSTELSIRERSGGNVFVENISSARIDSLQDLNDMLARGDANRATAATHANAASSRSHAALVVNLSIPDADEGERRDAQGVSCKGASLVLVDLAGSERHEASAGKYLRLEEAKKINLSLSALGNCMSALAEGRPHVPYRDSKLTRLLQGSLGGGARTAVIVNLPPGGDTTGESLNALRFASRAKKVKVVSKVERFVDYEVLYRAAQKELDECQDRLMQRDRDIASLEARADRNESRAEDFEHQVTILRRHLAAKEAQPSASIGDVHDGDGTGVVHKEDDKVEAAVQVKLAEMEAHWQKQMQELTGKHLEDVGAVRREYAGKVAALRRDITSLKSTISQEQDALFSEREGHLATIQELNRTRQRVRDEDAARAESTSDALQNLDEKRRNIEALEQSVRQERDEIERMRETMATMVSKSQIADMERLFEQTVATLTKRLESIEGPSTGAAGGSDDDDDWSLGSPTDNFANRQPLQPAAPTQASRMGPGVRPPYQSSSGSTKQGSNARIEIGRVRKVGGGGGGKMW